MKRTQKAIRFPLIMFALIIGSVNINAQSVFDKFENFLVSKRLQLSYGVQSSWYKESQIHFIQKKYNRNLRIYDVLANDRGFLSFLLKGEVGVTQYKLSAEIDVSPKYSVAFFLNHMGYHVDVERNYYKLGTWDNESISNRERLSNDFIELEHSNGINIWNFGVLRRIKFTKDDSKAINFEVGFMPNIGLVSTATQAVVFNPSGEIERYNPGNKLAGYNYGVELVLRIYLKKHYFVGLNFNYFQMQIKHARLDADAHVEQELRGSTYGINIGYKF